MATNLPVNGAIEQSALSPEFIVKAGLARMLCGGVIMDVVNAEQVHLPLSTPTALYYGRLHQSPLLKWLLIMIRIQQARIAEEAGAVAVMALERVPADIRVQGGVARMSDPKLIKEIMAAVTIPVMAKARIGHFVECQVRISFIQSPPIDGY